MITRSTASRLAVLGAAALLTAAGAGVAAAAVPDPVPVGPNQSFSGTVNGQATSAAIRTDCGGPIVVGETGHPVAGQSVAAVLGGSSTAPGGYTGTVGHSLLVTLDAATSTADGVIGTTTNYYVPLAIPTTLTVPCSGTGTVVFTPGPTSATARAATVTVAFLPVGVTAGN
ncbi:hypothetical protein POF50_000355 [Streptomyces sp. SL13]|uniref:Uncharacterized protein n=1 Tax=Streptantibioticus silvisoli TaxID=2705255 RepID=A0AA90H025_9ACTN|nr:hypothetical protein [Streptantibioticus silvisoli]MDI5963418.1 hypothetical protein [Streptantibioticus silvisoli]MDI5967817.1 hypothetical protein [Streptantibioticus silvisoli]